MVLNVFLVSHLSSCVILADDDDDEVLPPLAPIFFFFALSSSLCALRILKASSSSQGDILNYKQGRRKRELLRQARPERLSNFNVYLLFELS